MAILQLILHNAVFQEMDIELPGHRDLVDDHDQNFELNCQLRDDYIKLKIGEMRALYIRQIIKCQHEYEFILLVKSKFGEPNLLEDSKI